MTEITLTPWEIMTAAQVGVMRQVESMERGHRHRHGADANNAWNMNIEGALSECAFAKLTGHFWSKGTCGGPDVGIHYQVRSTHRHNGCLILHPDDPDRHIFSLMIGSQGTYRYAGSITGHAGKQPELWRTDTGRPAYFVPQQVLVNILDDLRHVA